MSKTLTQMGKVMRQDRKLETQENARKMLQRMIHARQPEVVSPARGLYTTLGHPCLEQHAEAPTSTPEAETPVPTVASVSSEPEQATPPQTLSQVSHLSQVSNSFLRRKKHRQSPLIQLS